MVAAVPVDSSLTVAVAGCRLAAAAGRIALELHGAENAVAGSSSLARTLDIALDEYSHGAETVVAGSSSLVRT